MRVLSFIGLLAFSSIATAQAFTDIWWNPMTPGDGVTVLDDGDVLIVTQFVHDASGEPRWYTASLRRTIGPSEAYDGPLIETRLATRLPIGRTVGRMTFRPGPNGKAELEYDVDGTRVAESIERFTTTADRLEGLYVGSMLSQGEACRAGTTGPTAVRLGAFSVERCEGTDCLGDPTSRSDRSPFHLRLGDTSGATCRIDGRFRRYGRSGSVEGTYACSDGSEGTIALRDIEFTELGFSARLQATHPDCSQVRGAISGLRSDTVAPD